MAVKIANGEDVETYAMLDRCSTGTFEDILEDIRVTGHGGRGMTMNELRNAIGSSLVTLVYDITLRTDDYGKGSSTKDGRFEEVKRYCVILTCMSSRQSILKLQYR